jgi:molybdopterin synthase sulfur carrier subunit
MPLSPAKDRFEAPTVTVRVRLFASLREAMGWGEQLVTPAVANPTPLTLWRQLNLTVAWPPGSHSPEGLPGGVRVAINQRFAPADSPLADGDELAFLPPITGG